MKFICLGYLDETMWAEMTEADRSAAMEECFAYDDELRRGGSFLGGEALQSVRSAVTLRSKDGRVDVTDGPHAETKEHLGGYFLIDVDNLDEAIAIAGRIPGARRGTAEIRPLMEVAGLPEPT